ncbi:MAG: hypothetical protein IJS53_01455 [Clostridia bacterium]|nr:hypothetical protein [Clostridia bacterium]
MRKLSLILALLLLFALPAHAEGAEHTEDEIYLKGLESTNRVVTVLGKTYLVFAQNSPEWGNLRSDNNLDNPAYVNVSACVPFTIANVTVNAIPYEKLPLVTNVMRSVPRIDRYTASTYYGRKTSERFEIKENCDFLRYWPLLMVAIAAGNNQAYIDNPQSLFYVDVITRYFNIKLEECWILDDAMEALDQGALIMTNFHADVDSYGNAIGHYFVFVGRDEEYAYMLDSNFMREFPLPMGYYVELVEPGVERIRLENIYKVNLGQMLILWPLEDFTPYTAERYQEILDESNNLLLQ